VLAVAAMCASLLTGELSWSETEFATLWSVRGSRTLLAFGVGGALSVAGMLLQAQFSNPLCEPYTLGVSSGAALGAVLSGAFGVSAVFEGMAVGPLLGALLFAVPLLAIRRGEVLLLAGVLLGLFGSSLVALVMALSDARGVAQALGWLLGDLSRATDAGAMIVLGSGLLITLLVRRRHAELDTLLMGEKQARSVGVPVESLRREIVLASSLLVALGVAFSGMIGFIGLMVPHAIRQWQGAAHRRVLPLAWLAGGAALVTADAAGRAVFSPRDVPIGVVTALVGVPLYGLLRMWQVRRERRG
jgi:iron complex transport system permease protein